MNKSIMDLAARSFFSNMKILLVQLLNERNKNVFAIHESFLKKKILTAKNDSLFEFLTINDFDHHFIISNFFQPITPKKGAASFIKTVTNLTQSITSKKGAVPSSFSSAKKSKSFKKKQFSFQYESDAQENQNDETDNVMKNFDYQISNQNSDEKAVNENDDNDGAILDESDEKKAAKLQLHFDDMNLEFNIIKKFKKQFQKLIKTQQKKINQNMINFELLLKLSSNKVYTTVDLENERILDRVLRLLFVKRFEKNELHIRFEFHFNYDKLSKVITAFIKKKLLLNKCKCRKLFKYCFKMICKFQFHLLCFFH